MQKMSVLNIAWSLQELAENIRRQKVSAKQSELLFTNVWSFAIWSRTGPGLMRQGFIILHTMTGNWTTKVFYSHGLWSVYWERNYNHFSMTAHADTLSILFYLLFVISSHCSNVICRPNPLPPILEYITYDMKQLGSKRYKQITGQNSLWKNTHSNFTFGTFPCQTRHIEVSSLSQ